MNITSFDLSAQSENVKELLHEMEKNLHSLAQRTVAVIRDEVEAYDSFPLEVHVSDNVVNLRNLIAGLTRFAPPDEQSITHASFMGRQRVLVHLPLAAATEGYHIGYAMVWKELLALANATQNPVVREELTGYVTPLWSWFQELSSAFSAAYLEEQSAMKAAQSDLKAVIYESLRSDNIAEDRALAALEAVGLEAHSSLAVAVAEAVEPDVAQRLAERLRHCEGAVELIVGTPETVLIAETQEIGRVVETLRAEVKGVGVGSEQPVGALARSYDQARQALECTHDGRRVAHFAHVWPLALVRDNVTQVSELFEGGMEIALTHPHLAQTVAAFTKNRFSITSTARAEHLHPNTAKYRLDRWNQLTGWDVYELEGLMNSVACLELVHSPHEG